MKHNNQLIQQRLDQLTFLGPLQAIELLEQQGAINRTYKIQAGETFFLVKEFARIGEKKLDRKAQFDLQSKVAKHGLAPCPRYLSPQQDLWVEDWHQHQKSGAPLARAKKIELIASTLARLHQIEIECEPLLLIQDWYSYLKSLPNSQRTEFSKQIELLKPQWNSIKKEHLACCHHDLSFANISMDGSGVCFDWEYAALSSIYYDLASSIVASQLDSKDTDLLIYSYATVRAFQVESVKKEVNKMLPLARLTQKLWYAVVSGE